MAGRTGRRPGDTSTRDQILAAAREAFAEKGYDGASIRGIAAGAGVDPALVHHYFGTKDKLFLAGMNVPIDLDALVKQVLGAPRDEVGVRLVRAMVGVWDSPAGASAVAVLRSAMSNVEIARMMREFIVSQLLSRVIAGLGIDRAEAPLRTALVLSQVVGVAVTRHVLHLDPIASIDAEQLVAAIGPTVQRYLTGDVLPPR
ncbi:TetR/AcrR family transcriptional regulator [Paractinoplanes durhamensis]|uniref:TetR family transcriptional regulator n=1 Tax=Paractinoplanes durhamensis TaxID=113563 RepID=A0ABQ3Z4L9_9ACTN|nr:TetR family transcriptional regulator [Actinoplanes durhamensis]GIE04775.1 TetR family transcriptional regulator [Actinoplanes durhamensis]